ncbi:hypothetical protein Pst134EA_013376 [Puccinia striiformis f. sp. tritici]|nr:hypothetical protein Pst134EA_013376 [Puccinia striiformis f. sp. tritici]KAI9603754.1 hypothetical protein H4Q26_003354 [Puccinia striiformis f. sp. tritici PST-130]KNE89966.1 hypothetical protein PSTG_16583 [Puccinia striiformis f. sp. tritici PST-78]KAH9454247.1 hypothetical protein Pst134EB_014341 [Puccinia striiformis f. sp. tritici]KAH9465495.1 hypothetical protein Pst134EA_013376 [Puccinia striiformis f. sp. tritici]KAI9613646.1 hypothetical protein KEM48_003775 [Puccinia striiformis
MTSWYWSWSMKVVNLGVWVLKFNAALVAVIGVLLYSFQGKMIYPSSMPEGSREKVPQPSEFDIKDWEEIELIASDQVKTKAFVILASSKSEKNASGKALADWRARRPTILMLHANAGNVGHRLPIAKVLVEQLECNVVAISYRGYGHSSGTPSEKGILLDSQTALDYIQSHPILESSRIYLYGQSLGGAVAIAIASDKINAGKITGVILENTFANLRKLIPVVMPMIGPLAFLCHQTWYSDKRMSQMASETAPAFLFLSGTKDDLIPTSHFRILYDLCPSKQKRWKAFKDGTHNDTCLQKDYFPAMGSWIEEIHSSAKHA